ncbi:hypothetical protein [Paenibacillus sp. FJAT-26967]|uniref:hypothetical protein n=1 Tax=Paenibacillus sp. FJAT-26967 TaxID=1729690 RepID=UPI0008394DC7|nr:hypothetical protein [Paenibacillus sp. FJAT-26967]
MNKYTAYIFVSILVILIPLTGLLYGLWDMNQPKVGPIGNGDIAGPSTVQLIVIISTMLTGILNLIIAVKTYSDQKKSK